MDIPDHLTVAVKKCSHEHFFKLLGLVLFKELIQLRLTSRNHTRQFGLLFVCLSRVCLLDIFDFEDLENNLPSEELIEHLWIGAMK